MSFLHSASTSRAKSVKATLSITLAGNESVSLPDESVIDGLPVEIHDIAPRGFLGRIFSRGAIEILDYPKTLPSWSDHHVLAAVTRRGEDLPGNLVIGKESFERWQELSYDEMEVAELPILAEAALAGEHTGSPAGGARPKFACLHQGEHCIVKFSNAKTDYARRWQGLLRLEHLALETLRDHGIRAARSELVDHEGQCFLAIYRFGRVSLRGRFRTITLGAACEMEGRTWMDAAHALSRNELLNAEHVRQSHYSMPSVPNPPTTISPGSLFGVVSRVADDEAVDGFFIEASGNGAFVFKVVMSV